MTSDAYSLSFLSHLELPCTPSCLAVCYLGGGRGRGLVTRCLLFLQYLSWLPFVVNIHLLHIKGAS